ncbi:DnaJ domain-containing protein [Thalassospira sp.]|uniref:J domain-containing protein n=1 Tax=Thalassospira sp. TaxID=1912094 RepID=UPI000C613EC0|nr:DnaJ domain-containing protein [Thalassospira sp.]MBC05290.1 molecular chaperone DnaJ [Thalassospira sp.]|tara:strand:+ start:2382 stop:3209 length:828 start_codon:yes stop_codon:yes gene_type:complete
MQWLLIGIAAFVGVGFFIRWMTEAEPKEIRKIVLFLIILVLIMLAGWLLLTGKIAAMGAALAAMVPFLVRMLKLGFLWPVLRRIFASTRKRAQPGGFGTRTAGAGSSSEIRTEFLHMMLDLETGQMRGGVVSGPYEGANLDSLGLDDLQSLYVDCCSATDQSRAVLEAYLDRRPDCAGWQSWRQSDHGEDGAQNGGNDRNYNEQGRDGERSSSASGMTADEARKILGVGENATRAEINRAYKKQIKAVHPDHGGSDYLASKINAARSLLLRLCKD